MKTAILVTAIALGLVAFLVATRIGRAVTTASRVLLSWLWLTRVSFLGLMVLWLLPLLARGGARVLVIGVFDLHGNAPGKPGAFIVGLLLVFAVWTVHVTAGLTLFYGRRRTKFTDRSPRWLGFAFRTLAVGAIPLNAWTVLAATDERMEVGQVLAAGLVAGFFFIWGVERLHQATTRFPMARFHLLPNRKGRRAARELSGCLGRLISRLNDLKLSDAWVKPLRGYVGRLRRRTYIFPGHELATIATGFFVFFIFLPINFLIQPDSQLTALAYLLVSLITWVWVLAGATFFFDAYRIPVLLPLVAWLIGATFFARSDHYYRIWPAPAPAAKVAAADGIEQPIRTTGELTPGEVLARAASKGRRIVLVAAAGGGIQATAWTAKVLTELERACVEKKAPGKFASSVQMLSGVSGGSGGVMFFAVGYGADGFPGPGESEAQRKYDPGLLDGIAAAANATSLGQTTWGLAYPDCGRAYLPFFIVDPYRDRGEAMELAWAFNAAEKVPSLGGRLRLASLREWQEDVRAGLRPAVIFNSTIVETGQRMCFSTAPLSKGYEGRCEFWAPDQRDPNDLRAEMFLHPGADLRIITAARLSSTFPFVSPLARPGIAASRESTQLFDPTDKAVSEKRPDLGKMVPGTSGKLHLADGGYYENSGLSDLAVWLDDGLTALAQQNEHAGRKGPQPNFPAEVLVMEIVGFPESEQQRAADKPTPPAAQRSGERGTLFQIFGPISTLVSVRGAGHTAFTNDSFALLRHRWRIGANPTTIRHVRFVLPKLESTPPTKSGLLRGWRWPAWAEAKPEQPPLSWHLRGPEQEAIKLGWEQLMSEAAKSPRFEELSAKQQADEWEKPKTHPIEKVIHFLFAPPPAPANANVPAGTQPGHPPPP